jgi:hypothetical protein
LPPKRGIDLLPHASANGGVANDTSTTTDLHPAGLELWLDQEHERRARA